MPLPWKRVALVVIPAKPAGLWELALDYVSGSRLVQIRVMATDDRGNNVETSWKPDASASSTADGIDIEAKDACTADKMLSRMARRGALIAKIGGSTADIPDGGNTAAPWANRKVFTVGSRCVVPVASTEGGPLFLTMNDCPSGFPQHEGRLHVLIEEYPV